MDKPKRSKYYPIHNCDWIRVKYGTLDKNHPDIIFIRARTRVKSDHTKQSYSKETRSIKNTFKKSVLQRLSPYRNVFNENYIANLELSDMGLAVNKSSVLKYDIYLKPKNVVDIYEYNDTVSALTLSINNDIMDSLRRNNIMLA